MSAPAAVAAPPIPDGITADVTILDRTGDLCEFRIDIEWSAPSNSGKPYSLRVQTPSLSPDLVDASLGVRYRDGALSFEVSDVNVSSVDMSGVNLFFRTNNGDVAAQALNVATVDCST